MIDINQIRADFARYLAEHAATRHSLDAALMHVVERAYQQGIRDGADDMETPFARIFGCLGEFDTEGIEDAMPMPPVLRDAIPILDAGTPSGLRGPLAAGATAVPAAGVPGPAAGAWQGGGAEGGDGKTACRLCAEEALRKSVTHTTTGVTP